MSFLHQLRVLLWKNFSLRKRQPLRNIIEIFWPLALFIILVLVRQRRPPENREHSYYKPRALPSAGALPFLQSFICDFSNANSSSPEDLPNFSNGSLYRLAEDLSPLIQNKSNVALITRVITDYGILSKTLAGLNIVNLTNTFKPGSSLSTLLRNASTIRKFILDHTSLNETYVDALLNSPINFDKAADFYTPFLGDLQNPGQAIADIINLPNRLRKLLCDEPGLRQIFELPSEIYKDKIQSELCTFSTQEWGEFGRDLLGSIDLQKLRSSARDVENFERFEKTLQLVTKEVQRLGEDINSLQSLEPALRDLGKLRTIASGNSSLDIRSIICGRSIKEKAENDVNFYQQIQEQAAEGSASRPSAGTICSDIDPPKRVDCGWPGISEGTCLSMGCCYDSSVSTAKYCFCKPGQQRCCTVFNRFVQLIGGVTGRAGAGYADSGFVMFAALILRGKIFYTPDTPKSRLVIKKVNSFISQIDSSILSASRLKSPLEAILNYTDANQREGRMPNVTINSDVIKQLLQLGKQLGNPTLTRYADLLNRTEVLDFIDNIDSFRNETLTLYNLLDLTDNVARCFNTTSFFEPFPDEATLVTRAVDQSPGKPLFLSSIIFLNLDDNEKEFPKKVEYKLRLNPDFTPGTDRVKAKYWRPGPGPYGDSGFTTLSYINFGFIFLQDLVERALVEIITNKTIVEPGIYVQQFPYPCYIKDRFTYYISRTLPLFMTLAWVYTVAMIVKSIVYEKELRLKEVMKIMGLSNTVHWTAWFITSLVTMLITIILQCMLWKWGGILQHSDPSLVFFMLLVFAIASINLCFLISVFFSNANVAAACGGIVYFFTYLPYPITIWFEEQMTATHKSLAGLLSTTAFGMGCQYLSRYEEQGIGVQWSNYYESPLPDDNYSLGMTINMMMLDAIIYFVLVWYFEKVLPGEYGIPRPLYFPFMKSYWLGKDEMSGKVFVDADFDAQNEPVIEMPELSNGVPHVTTNVLFTKRSQDFESDPPLPVGVHIQNLVKVYSRGRKRAVDGLSLKLFEGQVTSLLGHNGAGKSTTMSVLTGLFPPTAGTAVVYGKDIRTDMDTIRKGLGMCPQHNVLFDDLTVEEHMWFYAKLKGMENKDIPAEIVKFLDDVGLPEKRREVAKNLSGGMKRKLSVALAFIANSRTVILDEPTAGVDPYSRRGIWDLILKYKEGKTILLSTHYMDEADLLGDRISIINKGKLKCSGTSLFLKRRFGNGYFLTLVKEPQSKTPFNEESLTKFVTSHVHGSFLKEHIGAEISYVLPSSARETGSFGKLFRNLESSLANFGVSDYGISDTTLEEVFLEACKAERDIVEDDDNLSLTGPVQRRSRSFVNADTISLHSQTSDTAQLLRPSSSEQDVAMMAPPAKSKLSRWRRQWLALVVKRFHHSRRSRKGFFSQIVLPAIFVAAAMIVALLRPPKHALPSLKLTPSQYGPGQNMFVENKEKNMSSQSYALTKALVNGPGPGIDCVHPSKCAKGSSYPFFNYKDLWQKEFKNYPPCPCQKGKLTCSDAQLGPKPPQGRMASGEVMVDLSTRNVSDYIIKTTRENVKLRYGGISFGEKAKYYPNLEVTDFDSNTLVSQSGVLKNAKVWFNNKGFHSMPTFLNVLNNALLRGNLKPGEDPRDFGIVAYNHPMDYNKEQLSEETVMQGFTDLFVAIFVIVALSFVPASFVVYLISDRVSKSKHLQFVSGLNPVIYWLANYAWDMINYLIPAFCCLLIFLVFNQKSYVSSDNFPVTFCLLLLYGWSMTPLMYPSSFVFKVPSTAYIVLICGNLFVGIVGTISTFILELFQDDQELLDINRILKNVFLLFPNYCLGRGLMDLARNQFESEIYARFGQVVFKNPFSWNLVGRNLFAMFFSGIIYMIINLLVEYRFFVKPRQKTTPVRGIELEEDEDVTLEKERVRSAMSQDCDTVRVLDLTKVYRRRLPKRTTLAVDHLTFGVQKGECFGLLGVNGAGKTSTFKMLTGDASISAGNAFIGPHSVLSNLNQAHQLMGYCPQFDALDELLTGRETLTYYARIKGFEGRQVNEIVEWALTELGLDQYGDVISGDYSGGNKRKLSTSLALLGYPPIIFLDEPTTGMDPGARRFLWDVISDIVRQGRSVVLTSHSMEECETLCTRLGIMVNGKFMCFGSPQHLRSKYGDGYTMLIRAKYSEVDFCKDFVLANFPLAKLKDQHHNMLEYHLPASRLRLSQVFDILENLRNTNTIFDYSVSQTTLDQIFVNFARRQTEGIEVGQDQMRNQTEA